MADVHRGDPADPADEETAAQLRALDAYFSGPAWEVGEPSEAERRAADDLIEELFG